MPYGLKTLAYDGTLIEIDGEEVGTPQQIEDMLDEVVALRGDLGSGDVFTDVDDGLAPSSGGGTTNFLRADGTWSEPPGGAVATDFVKVTDYGATGNGVTDDRAAIQDAIDDAILNRVNLLFPPGRYLISQYLYITDAYNIRIYGASGSVLVYASDDTGVVADLIAPSDGAARSCFYVTHCRSVQFDGLTFQGGTSRSLIANAGVGIRMTNAVNTTILRNTSLDGCTLCQQDGTANAIGTGDSFTVNAGVATIVNSSGQFHSSMVGLDIRIDSMTNACNNRAYRITSFVSSTTIRVAAVDGVTETSSFTWEVNNADGGTKILYNTIKRPSGLLTMPSDTKILFNEFEQPDTKDLAPLRSP